MEQLPVEHRGGPRQPEAGRGLRGRDARLRGAHHQGPQGRPLRLQQLLQAHIQGQFFKVVDEFVPVCLPVERVWKMSIGVLDGTVSPLPSVHSAVTFETVSVQWHLFSS